MVREPIQGAPSPLTSLRRHFVIVTLLSLIGVGTGLFLASQHPVTNTAEVRLAVGSGDLSDYQVPGFAEASKKLAGQYASFVLDERAKGQLTLLLGADAAAVQDVSATALPLSSVISVQALSQNEATANRAALRVANSLVAASAKSSGAGTRLLTAYANASERAAQARVAQAGAQANFKTQAAAGAPPAQLAVAQALVVRVDADLARAELERESASERYRKLLDQPSGSTTLRVVQQPRIVHRDLDKRLTLYGAAGLVLGLGLALVLTTLIDRLRARASRAQESRRAGRVTDDEHRDLGADEQTMAPVRSGGPHVEVGGSGSGSGAVSSR